MHEMDEAVQAIRRHTDLQPEVGLILGSGLSALADLVTHPVTIETSAIPGYPTSTVEGHVGRLVFGTIGSTSVVFVQGRLHVYEGHEVQQSTFPVRLLSQLGVSKLILTNAAGGIHADFSPGTLMWITDHINWTHKNPLIGSEIVPKTRYAYGASCYDHAWTTEAQQVATSLGISTSKGTYLWTLGPSYETKAEIRAFKMLGADAVGMSTVPEAIQARSLGMRVLGLSTITNFAAGLGNAELNHQEVLDVGRGVQSDLERLILSLLKG